MGKHILTVTLNPVLDQLARLADFSLGRENYLPEFIISAGGKGINVARTLNNLKIKSVVTGLTGGATGNLMEKMLDEEKIRHDFVRILPATRKSMTLISARLPMTRIIEQGPRVSRDYQGSFLRKFKARLVNCSWVVISGRPAVGMPGHFYNKLIALADARGVKTILDTSGNNLSIAVKARPFVVKPNLEEAEYVLGKRLTTITQLKTAARYFLRLGIKIVIVSLGEKGAVAADEMGCWFARAPKVKVQNTVGCGDAMVGGFLYGYQMNQDLGQCLATAVAAGAANCLSLQPGQVTLQQVMDLRKKVEFARC